MKRIIITALLVLILISGFFSVSDTSVKATGEYRPYLKILVWGTPSGTIGPMVKNILSDPTRGVNLVIDGDDYVTSFDKLEEKLRHQGYHVICLLDTDSTSNHDIPLEIEELIKDRCCAGISGLITSGHILEPSANNEIIRSLAGAQFGEMKEVGRTIIRVIDTDHEIVRDVAQSFQCHLDKIHEPILYPTTHPIAQTNSGIKMVWTNDTTCGTKAGSIALGTTAIGFGNIEMKRIFCHMLYYVMGSGWLQAKEAPINVVVTPGDGKALIEWEEPQDSSPCFGFRVYRQKNGGEWIPIHDFPLIDDETQWMDINVENGEQYSYKVCCVSGIDETVACSHVAGTTPGKPTVVIDESMPEPGSTVEVVGDSYTVKGKADPGSKVVIEWTLQPSGISGTVETIADEDGSYEAEIPLTPGQTVEYMVTVENELGDKETIGPFYVKCRQEQIIIMFTIGSNVVYVDGYKWPRDLDTAPFITVNDRTMVPFRFIGERLGATLDYSPKPQTGEKPQPVEKVWYEIDSATEGHVLVEVWMNKTTAKKNGKPYEMDQAPFIKNGRTVVPVRFVTEMLGAKVEWFDLTKQVKVTYPNPD